jgi:hypothetical protein
MEQGMHETILRLARIIAQKLSVRSCLPSPLSLLRSGQTCQSGPKFISCHSFGFDIEFAKNCFHHGRLHCSSMLDLADSSPYLICRHADANFRAVGTDSSVARNLFRENIDSSHLWRCWMCLVIVVTGVSFREIEDS